MKNIAAIENKITELEKKKTEFLHKQSFSLFKKLSVKLGESFSPELVFAIVNESWNKAAQEHIFLITFIMRSATNLQLILDF